MLALLIILVNVLPIISNGDICISRDPELATNSRFLGNYKEGEETDLNGNTYYEKDQEFCDTEPEYLYLKDDRWIVSPVLNGNDSYLACSTQNHETPDLCPAETWNNGDLEPDTLLEVTTTACPEEDLTPMLECNYILLQDTGNAGGNFHDGSYTKTSDNLYKKNSYYLQYSKLLQSWIVQDSDVRESCTNTQYYFRATGANINGLSVGDENVTFEMSWPLQEGDYSCKQPKISCLNSEPSAEILNDALCNYPCNIVIPSLPCNYIEIDIQGADYTVDGTYSKVDDEDNLYQNGDYFFQYYVEGGYYIINENDDRNTCGGGVSYSLRSDDPDIDTLQHGDSINADLENPPSGTATINCLANPPTTPSPDTTTTVTTTASATTLPATTSPDTTPPVTTAVDTTTSSPVTTTSSDTTTPETTSADASLPSDICISGDSPVNQRFLGNYRLKIVEENIYYEKDQALCDNQPEYLYLANGEWKTHPELGVDDIYTLLCPQDSIASPDLCTETWLNAGVADSSIQVTDTACPEEESVAALECEYILLQDTGNANGNFDDGLYTKSQDNLYQKGSYYFQYSKVLKSWLIAQGDVRESCDPTYYFKSDDTTISELAVGDDNVVFEMSWPVQDGDYSCKQPKISCLDSEPTDEVLNDASCNYPCNIVIPSLSCAYIEIDIGGGDYTVDGIYSKVDDNLYQNGDYFFQYYVEGGYYLINENDDRNTCDGGISYSLRSDDPDIDTLQHGDSINADLDNPPSGTATINCLAQPPTASPVPAAPDGLCVTVSIIAVGWSRDQVLLTDIAGTYDLMSEEINDSPAYELIGCSQSAYISVDTTYGWYFLSLNASNPVGSTWFTYCSNTDSIDGDLSQCIWSNGHLFEVTLGGGCACGQTFGSSALSPMIEPRDIQPKLPNENIKAPSTDAKPIAIWSQFVDILHKETISIALVFILMMMMIWTIVMCGYLFRCKKSNKKYYSPVKFVDDI